MSVGREFPPRLATLFAVLLLASGAGCGTTKMRTATDQLLLSDAVDTSISAMDFRPLTGKTVYLDSTYLQPVKALGFVNSDYIISSLRQQIMAAGCLLQDDRKEAELIIEARVGTLGADGYQVSYGIPASNALSTASALIPEAPPVPMIPEISLARRESNEASAKIAAFAYDRETRQAVWQSGISRSSSDARDMWVLGVGPFESGKIRDKSRLAGNSLPFNDDEPDDSGASAPLMDRPPVDFAAEVRFKDGFPVVPGAPVAAGASQTDDAISLDPSVLDELKSVSFEEAVKRAGR